ncbi:MAG: 3-methyl-2-oxobutanoate dehydrogenase subunit VorB [Oscillospiraceae bacterium]|nr:3-methyl-2-oxobutanoate dehydrogenase subunit VorB [Oscillospiraceae bacterium]
MRVLMKGNEAISEAALCAGCRAYFGYPITPQNEISEYMSLNMIKAGGVFVQSESEIAAINMVYGAAACGVRALTSSSSPGIALMQEGITYLAAAKLPSVIVNISRGGPGLGGILPSQGDYFQATRGGGNGDYYVPVYAPCSIQEAADLVQKAFQIAFKYRTPVMVMADGMLGQMMEPVEINEPKIEYADTEKWAASGNLIRGKRNVINSLYLDPEPLEKNNIELFKIYDEITKNEKMYESTVSEGDEIVFVSYGTPSRIVKNAILDLKKEGIRASIIRPITLWPFPDEPFFNIPKSVKAVLCCELSMGQLIQDVKLSVLGKLPVYHYGRVGGMIFEPEEIVLFAKKVLKEVSHEQYCL